MKQNGIQEEKKTITIMHIIHLYVIDFVLYHVHANATGIS